MKDKELEFRQYVLSSGLFEQVIKLFVALKPQPHISDPHDLLVDYFGKSRHPICDEIESLQASILHLKDDNTRLEVQLAVLLSELRPFQMRQAAQSFWALLDPKLSKKDVPKKQVMLVLNGVEGKKANSEVQAMVPETVAYKYMVPLIETNDRVASIAIKWMETTNPWADSFNDELNEFWNAYRLMIPTKKLSFCVFL